VNFSAIKFLQSKKFSLEPLILNNHILILMQKIVNFELKFRNSDFLSAKLVLEFDEFVLKLNSHFPFVV